MNTRSRCSRKHISIYLRLNCWRHAHDQFPKFLAVVSNSSCWLWSCQHLTCPGPPLFLFIRWKCPHRGRYCQMWHPQCNTYSLGPRSGPKVSTWLSLDSSGNCKVFALFVSSELKHLQRAYLLNINLSYFWEEQILHDSFPRSRRVSLMPRMSEQNWKDFQRGSCLSHWVVQVGEGSPKTEIASYESHVFHIMHDHCMRTMSFHSHDVVHVEDGAEKLVCSKGYLKFLFCNRLGPGKKWQWPNTFLLLDHSSLGWGRKRAKQHCKNPQPRTKQPWRLVLAAKFSPCAYSCLQQNLLIEVVLMCDQHKYPSKWLCNFSFDVAPSMAEC